MDTTIARLQGKLIVSVQAGPDSPLHRPDIIAALAQAVSVPGCAGFRINGPDDVRAVRRVSDLVLLGIYKLDFPGSDVYITPTFEEARAVAAAGADIIAVDGTGRPRPAGETLEGLIGRIHAELRLPVMADVAALEEGIAAAVLGADIVATTMAGYTLGPGHPIPAGPDLELVAALAKRVKVPVIAEGRYLTPALARAALDAGAWAVVVGTAITNPAFIAGQFARALSAPSPLVPGKT